MRGESNAQSYRVLQNGEAQTCYGHPPEHLLSAGAGIDFRDLFKLWLNVRMSFSCGRWKFLNVNTVFDTVFLGKEFLTFLKLFERCFTAPCLLMLLFVDMYLDRLGNPASVTSRQRAELFSTFHHAGSKYFTCDSFCPRAHQKKLLILMQFLGHEFIGLPTESKTLSAFLTDWQYIIAPLLVQLGCFVGADSPPDDAVFLPVNAVHELLNSAYLLNQRYALVKEALSAPQIVGLVDQALAAPAVPAGGVPSVRMSVGPGPPPQVCVTRATLCHSLRVRARARPRPRPRPRRPREGVS